MSKSVNILVINCGSSSLKFQLIDSASEVALASGLCDRIGIENSVFGYKSYCCCGDGGDNKVQCDIKEARDLPDHDTAIKMVLDTLVSSECGVIADLKEIAACGHRVVSGGEFFSDSVLITDEVERRIEECIPLAPLHNPAHLVGIRACKKFMPGTPNVAVFDTAFHQSMPPHAYIYATPYEWYARHKIRRYGAHGTSHRFVSAKTAEYLGLDPADSKIIVCHLGNGSSICAVKNGKSVDTSMGLTPLEGLMMGTRSGDLDPAILEFIAKAEGLGVGELVNILNKKSGALGVSGLSSDFRDLLDAAEAGNERAELAINIFCYRVAKYIGAYVMAMGGVDAIAFCAGVGENGIRMRRRIVALLGALSVRLDEAANNMRGKAGIISTPDSKVKVIVMPTNEELVIAKDTARVIESM